MTSPPAARPALVLLLSAALHGCGPTVALKANWYLVAVDDPGGLRIQHPDLPECKSTPTSLGLYVSLANVGEEPVTVEKLSVNNLDYSYAGGELTLRSGGFRTFELGRFCCMVPTAVTVEMPGHRAKALKVPRKISTIYEATIDDCQTRRTTSAAATQ